MPDENPVATAAKLESHEKVCSERYGEIKDSFTRVHARLDKIIYAIIALLVTIVGWLFTTNPPWKQPVPIESRYHAEGSE